MLGESGTHFESLFLMSLFFFRTPYAFAFEIGTEPTRYAGNTTKRIAKSGSSPQAPGVCGSKCAEFSVVRIFYPIRADMQLYI